MEKVIVVIFTNGSLTNLFKNWLYIFNKIALSAFLKNNLIKI